MTSHADLTGDRVRDAFSYDFSTEAPTTPIPVVTAPTTSSRRRGALSYVVTRQELWARIVLVLALAGIGAFVYYYEWPADAEFESRRTQLATIQKDIKMGVDTARKLPEFRAQVGEL